MATANDMFMEVGNPGTATTLSAPGYTAGGTSITVGSTTNWPTATGVIFAIDEVEVVDGVERQVAGTYNEFEGTVASATSITNVDWVDGAGDRNYSAGASTRVYIPVSAERENRLARGMVVEHNQDGTHSDITADSITATDATFTNLTISGGATAEGWKPTGVAVNSVTANGNRSYNLTMASSMASVLSPGMRLRTTRTVAAPDQCADLEASSSQYFSKASPSGVTFTDDFTCMGWIKVESYGNNQYIIARRDADTAGWSIVINPEGKLGITSLRIASNNRQCATYQSVPLNRWVHVAATMDNSANTHTMYIDGVSVPFSTTTNGTITALVQPSVNLAVGARSDGASTFDGELAQVAVFSSVLDAATIRSYMSQGLSGSETNLVAAYSLDNSLLDLTANDNDLTANGGAVATATDSPFGTQADGTISTTLDYGIVTKVATTTVTVQVPEGCSIPTSGGVTTLEYSVVANPFNFPTDKGRWAVVAVADQWERTSSFSTNYQQLGSGQILAPVGRWLAELSGNAGARQTTITEVSTTVGLSTSTSSASHPTLTGKAHISGASATLIAEGHIAPSEYITVDSATIYYLVQKQLTTTNATASWFGSQTNGLLDVATIRLTPSYL